MGDKQKSEEKKGKMEAEEKDFRTEVKNRR